MNVEWINLDVYWKSVIWNIWVLAAIGLLGNVGTRQRLISMNILIEALLRWNRVNYSLIFLSIILATHFLIIVLYLSKRMTRIWVGDNRNLVLNHDGV